MVALTFLLFYVAVHVFFGQVRGKMESPLDVLIVIPAASLLLAKELIYHFLRGKAGGPESTESIGQFLRPYLEIVRDWFPFLVVLMMYYSLWGNATHLLVGHDRDAQLIAWDQRLFGFQASVALQRIVSPPLTAWMVFAYSFHLFNIPIVACFLYICRPRERFREMMCGLLMITFFGLIGYLVVPAIGPMYTLRGQFTVPLSQPLAIINGQTEFIDFARIKRDCFPSLHIGISFLVWLYAGRNSRRLFWILSPFILSLWVSTVYLRYHYLVDDVAGFILAPLCYWLTNWLFKRFGEVRVRLPLPDALASRIKVAKTARTDARDAEERP